MAALERGEYSALFRALLDGPDFRRLSAEARWCLVALKMSLPHWGIGVIDAAAHVLASKTGLSSEACAVALEELERERWIEREAQVVWLVRGLEFEPHVSADNPNHVKGLLKTLAGLPRLAIVVRFRSHYASWSIAPVPSGSMLSQDVPDAVPGADATAPEAAPDAVPEPSRALQIVPPDVAPVPIENPSHMGSRSISSSSSKKQSQQQNSDDAARATASPSQLAIHAQALTIAANRAITARWCAQPNPLQATSPKALQLAKTLDAAAVPSAFGERVIPEIVQLAVAVPAHMGYFTKAILDRWAKEGAAPRPAASAPPFTGFKRMRRPA